MNTDEMLKRLLKNFYIEEEGLFWSWKEYVSLKEEDKELNDNLIEFMRINNVRK